MFQITSNRIRDKVAFVEGNERLVLTVDVDPLGIIDEMRGVIADLKALNENSVDDDYMRVAEAMAVKMFGEKQKESLLDFYNHNPKQFFNIVSRYYIERLNGLVIAAQKKMGRKKGLFKK